MVNSAFREAGPDEAALVTSFVRQQYGESYREGFYDASWLKKRMEEGSLRFIFAVSGEKIVGIIGEDSGNIFETDGKIVQEGGKVRERVLQYILLVVASSHRGQGLGRGLFQQLLGRTKTEEWASIYGYCVTRDTVSQSFHAQANFKITGLLLNRYFYDYSAPNYAGLLEKEGSFLPKKRSNLILCLPGAKKNAGIIFAPQKYRPYIASVYADLGVEVKFAEDEAKNAEFYAKNKRFSRENCVCTVKNEQKQRYCEVYVWENGADFQDLLKNLLCEYQDYTFNVFVCMNGDGAGYTSVFLETNGFIFTGIQPLAGEKEFLIFHKTVSSEIHFSELKTLPAFAPRVEELRRLTEDRVYQGLNRGVYER